jgi:hypothetical protein
MGVMSVIDKDNKLRPTTAQIFSLADIVLQNKEEEHCKDILAKFKNLHFWSATETIWGREEAIVYDNVDGKMPTNRKDLIKKYYAEDNTVRIVPYGFKVRELSVSEFIKNSYVLAQVGNKDMIDIVKRVVRGLNNNKPCVDFSKQLFFKVKRQTALSFWGDNSFHLNGDYPINGYIDDSGGYAFKVSQSASAKK